MDVQSTWQYRLHGRCQLKIPIASLGFCSALDDWACTSPCVLTHSVPSTYHCLDAVLGFPFPGLASFFIPNTDLAFFPVCDYCSGSSETQLLPSSCTYLSTQWVSRASMSALFYCHLLPRDNNSFLLDLSNGYKSLDLSVKKKKKSNKTKEKRKYCL